MPNETRIDCYEKTSKAIDYVAAKNSEGTFKIKEKGKDEKAETIKLDDQTLYSNGIALDETDQSGYKEITTKSNLNTLKDRFTTYSYKIGENGTWTSQSTINSEEKIYKTSAFDYDIIQNDLLNEAKGGAGDGGKCGNGTVTVGALGKDGTYVDSYIHGKIEKLQ